MNVRYTLYKDPADVSLLRVIETLLRNHDISILPSVIVQHGHPRNIDLPAIYEYSTNELHEGHEACMDFYAKHSGVRMLE